MIDCVGPLSRTKSGHKYILTMMCVATRFPEAIPLKNISSRKIVNALIFFFTRVGLPKVIQTDLGVENLPTSHTSIGNSASPIECLSTKVSGSVRAILCYPQNNSNSSRFVILIYALIALGKEQIYLFSTQLWVPIAGQTELATSLSQK